LIAIDLGLPVVFWQSRPGRYGQPFKLYKFRTMRAPHDEQGNRMPDQHRVSKLGALLRLTRLDELPQLYNILVGEMSFVGPRPLLVTDHEPGTHDRLLVCPGLTGWAQVNGGRKLAPEDKAALDIWYVAHLSLILDFRIVLRTLLLLYSGEQIHQGAVLAARNARPTPAVSSGVLAVVARPAKAAATAQSAA
jgi:lipopolysaccharide/colanic/teichoic acid biosynthesis glycosyltransferase